MVHAIKRKVSVFAKLISKETSANLENVQMHALEEVHVTEVPVFVIVKLVTLVLIAAQMVHPLVLCHSLSLL
jgi:hypothetical protein